MRASHDSLSSLFYKDASRVLVIGHGLALRLAISIDVDGVTSPIPSSALHRSPGSPAGRHRGGTSKTASWKRIAVGIFQAIE